ncbi:MAG: hypothetical protein FI709_15685 [SAR202 cluster bacterium]|nr:hypothetical protein [SAR202 cluster bacterium]
MIGFLANRKHTRLRELLSAYIDGEVSASESLEVQEHLATCEACSEEMETLRFTVDLLSELPQLEPMRSYAIETPPEPAPSVGRFTWTARLATSAAALLLLALLAGDMTGLLVQQSSVKSNADMSMDVPAAAATPVPAAAPAAAPAPAPAMAAAPVAPAAAAATAAPAPTVAAAPVAPAVARARAAPAPAPAAAPVAPAAAPLTPETAAASAPAPPPAPGEAAAPTPAIATLQVEAVPEVEMAVEQEVELESPVDAKAMAAPVAPQELESIQTPQAGTSEPVAAPVAPLPAEALVAPSADEQAAAGTPSPEDSAPQSDGTPTLVAPAAAPVPQPQTAVSQASAPASEPQVAAAKEAPAAAPLVEGPQGAPGTPGTQEGAVDSDEDGLALPLRQFEIAVGAIAALLASAWVWIAVRRRGSQI